MSRHEKPDFGIPLGDSLDRFAAELAALSPRVRLDRDRLMYLAGQASGVAASDRSPRRWAWPAAFGGMTAVAASLLAILAFHPEPSVVERIVRVPMPASPESAATAASNAWTDRLPTETTHATAPGRHEPSTPPAAYLELRDRVLAMGLDSWHPPAASSDDEREEAPLANNRDALIRLLHEG